MFPWDDTLVIREAETQNQPFGTIGHRKYLPILDIDFRPTSSGTKSSCWPQVLPSHSWWLAHIQRLSTSLTIVAGYMFHLSWPPSMRITKFQRNEKRFWWDLTLTWENSWNFTMKVDTFLDFYHVCLATLKFGKAHGILIILGWPVWFYYSLSLDPH